jgi:acyl carrier protein phosphodiesterase
MFINLHETKAHMNYLAHAYLSFDDPAWTTGNLISDYVKGKKRYDYPVRIQQGISLHRAIDEFTDTHDGIKGAKEIFRPNYRLYSGAFVDVVYDHFLANDQEQFPNEQALADFTARTYASLLAHYHLLPPVFHDMFDRMRQQNWLYNYRYKLGMERSFKGLVWRSKYMEESETAYRLFESNYDELEASYKAFFPDLLRFTKAYILETFT